MRFLIEFELDKDRIYKDKNRIVTSWIKYFMKIYDEDMYEKFFNNGSLKKDYTFSLYLGENANFEREEIYIPNKRLILNFSCYKCELGLHFYNIFMKALNKRYTYKDLTITSNRINIQKDILINENFCKFKTLSPIIVREHSNHDNKSNYFHLLSTDDGKSRFVENVKLKLTDKFGNNIIYDLEDFDIQIISSRKVTVRHYDINIPSNICDLEINAKPYIIEYLYLSGAISSMNSSGFGMLSKI